MGNARRTGAWMTGSDGRRWFFDSGSTALDFAYSGDFGYDMPQWESLHDANDLTAWLATRFGEPAAAALDAQFQQAKSLRSAISASARAAADGQVARASDIDLINETATGPAIVPQLPGGSNPPSAPTVERMLATLAQDSIHALSAPSGRLRRCSADDCGLIFLDTSRPGTRRWCSMSRCGGRAKARAHYRRQLRGD